MVVILWLPYEDKYVTKRRHGVSLYIKPMIERDIPYKKTQINRRLCTTPYR